MAAVLVASAPGCAEKRTPSRPGAADPGPDGGLAHPAPLTQRRPPEPASRPPADTALEPDGDGAGKPAPATLRPGAALGRWFAGTAIDAALAQREYGKAAQALETWLQKNADSPLRSRARLLLPAARVWSGGAAAAAPALEALLAEPPSESADDPVRLLRDHLRMLAGEAWLSAEKPDQAVAHLDAIGPDFALAERASLLRARASRALAQGPDAAKRFAQHLARFPGAPAEVRLEAHTAIAAGGPTFTEAAARALRGVVARYPHTPAAIEADRRLQSLPAKMRKLTVAESLVRLQAQLDRKALKGATLTAADLRTRVSAGTAAWCQAGFGLATALDRMRKGRQAIVVYDELLKSCETSPLLPRILYYGAKANDRLGRWRTAVNWFERVGKVAPKDSLVDDALRLAGLSLRRHGKEARAEALLRAAVATAGDMAGRAAWALFWPQFEGGHLQKAADVARYAADTAPWNRRASASGRLLYWLGRTQELLKKKVSAALSYARCIREYPLTYYAMVAQERLRRLDPDAAKEALEASRKTPKGVSILEANERLLAEPGMKRAIELMRLGFGAWARAELDRLKVGGGTKETEDWLLALLYDRVGDYTRSHTVARFRRADFGRTFPAGHYRERWELAYPRPEPYRKAVAAAAKKHGVEEALIWAVMREESAFRTGAHSHAGAMGLMQLILSTGRSMAKKEGIRGTLDRRHLEQPEINIALGTRYLGGLSRRFRAHPALMASGYNAGPGGPLKWLRLRPGDPLDRFVERIPYTETRGYTRAVVTSWLRYRYLYYGSQLPRLRLRLPSPE